MDKKKKNQIGLLQITHFVAVDINVEEIRRLSRETQRRKKRKERHFIS